MGRSSNGGEPAEPLEAVAHLLFLEGELGGVGQVLQAAAAAVAEVGAGRLDAVGRGRQHRLDHPAPVAAARLDDPDPQRGRPGSPPRTNMT